MRKCERLVELLNEYMYRAVARYENDVTQISNNVHFRDADPLDHLEMIMAQTRACTAIKIYGDLQSILAIWRGMC